MNPDSGIRGAGCKASVCNSSVMGLRFNRGYGVIKLTHRPPVCQAWLSLECGGSTPLSLTDSTTVDKAASSRRTPNQRSFMAWRTTVMVSEAARSEAHTSELQSPCNIVCRLPREKCTIET